MTQTDDVEREDRADGGRFVIRLEGGEDGEMTYRKLGPNRFAFDHTFVPRAYRGAGIAQKLMDAAIAAARADGFTIVPVCSYVVAQFERHPEWADLRAEA